jgi:hypothetical protein
MAATASGGLVATDHVDCAIGDRDDVEIAVGTLFDVGGRAEASTD